MRLEPIRPKPRTSVSARGHEKHPYLLRDREMVRSDAVWASDIRYIPMHQVTCVSGFGDRLARSQGIVVVAVQQSGLELVRGSTEGGTGTLCAAEVAIRMGGTRVDGATT